MLGLKCRIAERRRGARRATTSAGAASVPAADNVVRLLPPLNLTEAEVDEGLRRLDAAAAALEAGGMRHFLDLHTTPAAELRAMLDAGRAR